MKLGKLDAEIVLYIEYDTVSLLSVVTTPCLVVWQSLGNIHYHLVVLLLHSTSLGWDKYQWSGIGDEEAIALADPRVINIFKTLE